MVIDIIYYIPGIVYRWFSKEQSVLYLLMLFLCSLLCQCRTRDCEIYMLMKFPGIQYHIKHVFRSATGGYHHSFAATVSLMVLCA